MTLKAFFDSVPHEVQLLDTFTVRWSVPGCGFGSFDFYEEAGKIHISNECMRKAFIKEVLCKLVDDAILDDEPRTPEPSEPTKDV